MPTTVAESHCGNPLWNFHLHSFTPHIQWLPTLFQDTWLYHLTVAAGGSSAKVGTAYEQLIGKLMDGEGDPGKVRVAIVVWVGGWRVGAYWSGTQKKALWYPGAVLNTTKS